MVVVSPAGTVVESAQRMTRSGLKYRAWRHRTLLVLNPAQYHRTVWGGQAACRAQHLSLPTPNASQHKEAARLRWGRRRRQRKLQIVTLKLGSLEAFPESQQVLRSETEGL